MSRTSKGIPFEVRDITKDRKYLDELVALGHSATPVTLIDDEPVVGFDVSRLEALLADSE